jgi:hypothetical protein
MSPKTDLTGRRFGRLVVLAPGARESRGYLWCCRCDCGNVKEIRARSLKSGRSASCGCAAREALIASNTTHGMTRNPLYWRWRAMLDRTTRPSSRAYPNYGGRGITVCDRWRDFANFHADMGSSFAPGLEIDRIDNDGNYEPGNCRWATRIEQQRNRRNNHRVTWAGRTMTVQDWGEHLGITPNTLLYRLRRGWDIDRAMTKDARPAVACGEAP